MSLERFFWCQSGSLVRAKDLVTQEVGKFCDHQWRRSHCGANWGQGRLSFSILTLLWSWGRSRLQLLFVHLSGSRTFKQVPGGKAEVSWHQKMKLPKQGNKNLYMVKRLVQDWLAGLHQAVLYIELVVRLEQLLNFISCCFPCDCHLSAYFHISGSVDIPHFSDQTVLAVRLLIEQRVSSNSITYQITIQFKPIDLFKYEIFIMWKWNKNYNCCAIAQSEDWKIPFSHKKECLYNQNHNMFLGYDHQSNEDQKYYGKAEFSFVTERMFHLNPVGRPLVERRFNHQWLINKSGANWGQGRLLHSHLDSSVVLGQVVWAGRY